MTEQRSPAEPTEVAGSVWGLRLKLALVLVVTAGCLVLALWGLDPQVVRQALGSVHWGFVLPMCTLYALAHLLRALRFGLLVGMSVPPGRMLSIVTVGFLAINVIPLRLGEMVRPYLLMERQGVPLGRGIAAVVLERLLDMLMLLGMLLGLTWVVDLPVAGIEVQGIAVLEVGRRIAGGGLLVGSVIALLVVGVGEPVIRLVERLPAGRLLGGFSRRFREGILELLTRPLRALLLLFLSVSIWGLTIAGVNVALGGFAGLPTGLGPAWTTWTVTLTGMTAVPTPGFFGSFEAACTGALVLWGVEADLARTFALVLHLTQFAFTIVIGSLALVSEGLGMRALVRPAVVDEGGREADG